MRLSFLVLILGFLCILSMLNVEALASYSTYQPRPSFQAIYGPEGRIDTYWPILGDRESCQSRQDLLLQVSPAGCQPTVVRSDLLAEQNVPVFCQIDALEINPLIDIDQIRGISFSGKYPQEVITAGFHPARAALRSRDRLLGSPLINNIGYVVVVLKRNPIEKNLPEFVKVNLTARIDYETGNAYGVGKAEFLLEPVGDSEWEQEKFRQSFWEGRYFVRLDEADPNSAVVSLYSGDRRIATTRVQRGEVSRTIWVPGAYCRAGVQVAYDGFAQAQPKATLAIDGGDGTDLLDVYEGSRFLNDRCSVRKITLAPQGEEGSVLIQCSGTEPLELKLQDHLLEGGIVYTEFYLGAKYDPNSKIKIFLDKEKKKDVGLYFENSIVYLDGREVGNVRDDKVVLNRAGFDYAVDETRESDASIKALYSFLHDAKVDLTSEIVKAVAKKDDKVTKYEEDLKDALSSLERVVKEYPAEKRSDVDGAVLWGELALQRAIGLSTLAGKLQTKAGLMRTYLDTYPGSPSAAAYRYELNRLGALDFSEAGGTVLIDGRYFTLRLLGLKKPTKQSHAEFIVSDVIGRTVDVKLGEVTSIGGTGGQGTIDSIRLDSMESEERVRATVNCRGEKNSQNGAYALKSASFTLQTGKDATAVCEKSFMRLRAAELQEIAKIRLLPEAHGTRTEANLTVNIGIEKRAIQLSTEKTEELIENLNESIQRWDTINQNLGKVVTGMKSACFATAGVLTVNNFLTGIGGEALARQKVMQSWTSQCNTLVNSGKYPTMHACYYGESERINTDVTAAQTAIEAVNTRIAAAEKASVTSSDSLFGGENVDRSKAAVAYCEDLKKAYSTRVMQTSSGQKPLTDILGNCDEGYNKQGLYGYNELREIEYQLIMQEKASSSNVREGSGRLLQSGFDQIGERRERVKKLLSEEQAKNLGLPVATVLTGSTQKNILTQVVSQDNVKDGALKKELVTGHTHLASVNAYHSPETKVNGVSIREFQGGVYYFGLVADSQGEGYHVQEVYQEKSGVYEKLDPDARREFLSAYGVGRITSTEHVSYMNPYQNPEVRYYETEPYKGMPAIVPFDVRNGWYAATRQTLPAFGGIGAFDSSGRVTSFWLCNVGKNKQEQFFEGTGDDNCQLINLNTGQPLGVFPGLSESEARAKVGEAVRAIEEAARQYGKKQVSINGKDYLVGNPAANIPETQCENFMSPGECHLLFNVCDPVICPSSRCDFGGKYPVADVVQTGIIGSTLLCLPNAREGIVVPVCLSGIHAGIDGFLSIMKNHRDCLQESLETGRTIGICDQIYSVYMCEFFWRQAAPLAKVALPKLIENLYGEGKRGGGEYLTTQAAWQNTQKSVDYFTQSYAVNSLKAFRARSVEEVGTPFCKAFISAKAPTAFESLVEPDSPPQFHAWFSSVKYSDVTIPATSQYKVFYHIFAGKDQGIYYSVYLKNPPDSGYYAIPAIIQVATGFVGRGQATTESRDFTAPEGYQELCVRVNDQEECGFKEVSTSFALNQLRDSYAADELEQSQITSESACISGSVNLKAAVLTPNVQAGAEETFLPKAYERGIVRICATENPGSKTDPLRFVDVGYCGDQKIRCWLDKESVSNAITDNNLGVQNATLSEIEKNQRAELEKKGIIIGDDVAVADIKEIKNAVDDVRRAGSVDATRVRETLNRLDTLFNRTVLNHHKAEILYLIGDLKAIVVEKVLAPVVAKDAAARAVASGATASVGGGATGGTSRASASGTSTSGTSGKPTMVFSLAESYDPNKEIKLFMNGKETKIYFEGSKVYLRRAFGTNWFFGNVGIVKSGTGQINLLQSQKDKINKELSRVDTINLEDPFISLDNAFIEGGKISQRDVRAVASGSRDDGNGAVVTSTDDSFTADEISCSLVPNNNLVSILGKFRFTSRGVIDGIAALYWERTDAANTSAGYPAPYEVFFKGKNCDTVRMTWAIYDDASGSIVDVGDVEIFGAKETNKEIDGTTTIKTNHHFFPKTEKYIKDRIYELRIYCTASAGAGKCGLTVDGVWKVYFKKTESS